MITHCSSNSGRFSNKQQGCVTPAGKHQLSTDLKTAFHCKQLVLIWSKGYYSDVSSNDSREDFEGKLPILFFSQIILLLHKLNNAFGRRGWLKEYVGFLWRGWSTAPNLQCPLSPPTALSWVSSNPRSYHACPLRKDVASQYLLITIETRNAAHFKGNNGKKHLKTISCWSLLAATHGRSSSLDASCLGSSRS